MGLFSRSHCVASDVSEIVLRDDGDGYVSIYGEDGRHCVMLSLSTEVAEDLLRRLEAYLMDRQLRAHPETVPGLVQIDEE